MSKFSKIAAVLLLAMAVILALFAWRLARQPAPAPVAVVPVAAAPVAPPAPQFVVVVAARPLVAGQPLSVEDVTTEMWQSPPSAGFTHTEAVTGELLRFDVAQGEPVTSQALMRGLANHLRVGERAVTVSVDEQSGPAAHLVPGDLVDVYLTLGKTGEVEGTQARLLQSRQRVLAYGTDSVDGPPQREPVAEGREGAGNARQNTRPVRNSTANVAPRTAVLAVPIADVNELLLANRHGKLQLVLRGPHDESAPERELFQARQPLLAGRADLQPAQRERLEAADNRAYAGESLLQFAGPAPQPVDAPRATPKPARAAAGAPAAPLRSVEVVRGGQREQVRY